MDLSKLITAADKKAAADAAQQAAEQTEARSYLASTDWMVIRSMEGGEAVPDEVMEKRAAARLKASI